VIAGGVAAGASAVGLLWLGVYLWSIQPEPDQIVAQVQVRKDFQLAVARRDLEHISLLGPGKGAPWRLMIKSYAVLSGRGALRAAGVLLPLINRRGGSRRQVTDAVAMLERVDRPYDVFSIAARRSLAIAEAPASVRLALEMATHEETERRAMEGELALLERAWREAEGIAAVADRLALPVAVERVFQRLKG
jgi:hypothetical protein